MICPRVQAVCTLDWCAKYGCVDMPIETRAVPEASARRDARLCINNVVLLALIERLAPADAVLTIRDHDFGTMCPHCRRRRTWPQDFTHADDCPWVEARRLIERTR